jgi:hypothetical protein
MLFVLVNPPFDIAGETDIKCSGPAGHNINIVGFHNIILAVQRRPRKMEGTLF